MPAELTTTADIRKAHQNDPFWHRMDGHAGARTVGHIGGYTRGCQPPKDHAPSSQAEVKIRPGSR
jgi:hypothetical protein